MLATIERLKKMLYIGEEDATQDEELEAVISAASEAIETRLRRKFSKATYEEKYDGTGRDQLVLDQFPVDTVTEVLTGGAPVPDFETIGESGILFRLGGWPCGRRNISVKYTAGYVLPGGADAPTLPKPIEQACLILARMIYTGEWGKVSERLSNGYAVTFTKGPQGGIPPVVDALVSPYKGRMV